MYNPENNLKMENKIYFLRHFKTLNNLNNVISGRSTSPTIATDFILPTNTIFHKIYCSPAERCRTTMNALPNNILDNADIIFDERLLERNLGNLEGMPRNNAIKSYPFLFSKNKLDVFSTPPNGESYEVFSQRLHQFYNDTICNMQNRQNILICSHNQTLKMLYHILTKSDITSVSWRNLSFDNGVIIPITKFL